MGWVGILAIVLGAVGVVFGTECVPETSKCSKYWVKIEPHRNLVETEKELDSWCSKQNLFYECLESVLLEGNNGNLSLLPVNLLISKLFAQDLCTDASTSRKRLLNNANCINQLNTEYCFLPEYLDIVTPDDAIPASRCSLSEKTFSCIAATMVLNCGFDAGRVYRTMLKITRYSDEVCDIEASEGIPPCEDSKTKAEERDQKLSEIYYGLFHRIGNIPEQDLEQNLSDQSASEDGSADEAVTVAIQNALDDLDRSVVTEEPHMVSDSVAESYTDKNSDSNQKPYLKNPLITDVYRGILFYNYSGLEYTAYWRQPDFVVIENITCEHLQPSYIRGVIFRCKIEYRDHDPDCVSKSEVHEKVTPELIRELDPDVPNDSTVEFGPRPEWMKDLDEAYAEKSLRELKYSSTPSEATEMPDVVTTSSNLLHVATTLSTGETENWWEWNRYVSNSIFPNDVHYELMELFMPQPDKYVPPPMNRIKVGNTLFLLIYDPVLTNSVENVTCSRLDECHPKGKGLWRCKMWRRKIETCDVCYGGTGAKILGLPDETKLDQANESQFETEADGSGMVELPSEESVTLVYGDGSSSNLADGERYPVVEMVELKNNEVSEDSEAEFSELDDAEPEESDEDGIQLYLNHSEELDRFHIKNILGSDSEETTEILFAIHTDKEDDGNDSTVLIPSDELLQENILLIRGVPNLDNEINEYKIIHSSERR